MALFWWFLDNKFVHCWRPHFKRCSLLCAQLLFVIRTNSKHFFKKNPLPDWSEHCFSQTVLLIDSSDLSNWWIHWQELYTMPVSSEVSPMKLLPSMPFPFIAGLTAEEARDWDIPLTKHLLFRLAAVFPRSVAHASGYTEIASVLRLDW